MNLNADILFDYLSQYLEVQRFGTGKDELYLGRPMFYDPGKGLGEARVYLCRSEILPAAPPLCDSLVICSGAAPPKTWLSGRIQLFLLPENSDLLQAFNRVQAAFETYDAWEARLQAILDEEADLDQMIEASAGIFGNQIMITDQDVKVRASGSARLQDGWQKRGQPVPFPLVTPDGYDQYTTQTRPFLHHYPGLGEDGSDLSVYSINLLISGRYEGCSAIVDMTRPFRQGDYPLFRRFTEFARNAVIKQDENQSGHAMSIRSVIKDLLDNFPVDDFRLNRVLGQTEPGGCGICLAVRPEDSRHFLPLEYVRATLEKIIPNSVAVVHDAEIVLILQADADGALPARIGETLAPFLDGITFKAGVSSPFNDIRKVRVHYLQACCALNVGRDRDPESSVFEFRKYVFPYMLSRCSGEFRAEELLSPGLQAVIEHDRSSKTEYWRTLRALLDNEMNIAETARSLYVHRNTLMSRLSHIYALLGTNLEDPAERLYTWMCIYVMANIGLPELPEAD